jgi:hypothetical protein
MNIAPTILESQVEDRRLIEGSILGTSIRRSQARPLLGRPSVVIAATTTIVGTRPRVNMLLAL